MALGRRKGNQTELFIATAQLVKGPGHPFYIKLREVLADAGFDDFAERLCAPSYRNGGRPSIAPGVYFRMIFIGYFEAWTASAASPGAVPTVWPCARFWESPSPRPRRCTPR